MYLVVSPGSAGAVKTSFVTLEEVMSLRSGNSTRKWNGTNVIGLALNRGPKDTVSRRRESSRGYYAWKILRMFMSFKLNDCRQLRENEALTPDVEEHEVRCN